MDVEIGARRGTEDVKNVVDGVDGYASRLQFPGISISEEVLPRRVQPQFIVDLCRFIGFCVRVFTLLAVMTKLFLCMYIEPTTVKSILVASIFPSVRAIN